MAQKKQERILLTCPHCGHQQKEPPTAFSTICKECGQHIRVQEILNPPPKASRRGVQKRRVTCFDCNTELDVPVDAESTMCKRCGRYVDLHDYHIASALAKNFKTKGSFVVEAKGCVFNTETVVGDAVIKGKFHGKLTTERSLTIYSGSDIKGTLTPGHLIIPAENHFRWNDPLQVGSAEIAGELAADLRAAETIILKSTARFFGDLDARHLVVEDGAVIVGRVRVRTKDRSREKKDSE
jgi:cytoskeletal protein CcmA (bactofilin family)